MSKTNSDRIEIVKVGVQKRDRRRTLASGRCERYATTYTWSAFVDGRLVMDGCTTKREANVFAIAAL